MTQELTNTIENIAMNFNALDELLTLTQRMFEFKTTVPMVTPNSKPADFKQANDALSKWQDMTMILPAIALLQDQLRDDLDELECIE